MNRWFPLVALVLALVLPVGAVTGQTRAVPTDRTQIQLSYAPLVKQTASAVVNIYTQRVVQARSPMFSDPFFQRFFGNQTPGRDRVQRSLGSGVIVRPNGIIVTNNHVIDGSDAITVALSDRREFEAELVLADPRTDLAILRIDTGGAALPALGFANSDAVEVGDLVLAIGNPFGVGQTVTSGIVSALARTQVGVSDYQFFVQTDAAINPGNSGGALIGMDGRLIGINSAIYSRDGGSNGIGFAIPANMVARVVDDALAGGKVVRPWFGVSTQPIDRDLAASMRLPRPAGVLVNAVHPDGSAARSGIRAGDVVLAIDGFEVDDPEALKYRIATGRVGQRASVDLVRGGRSQKVTLTLAAPPEVPARDARALAQAGPLGGVTVANLSPAYAEEMGLDPFLSGVVVESVVRGSPAQRLGLQPGDLVRRINGEAVATTRDLERVVTQAAGRWQIEIERDGRTMRVDLRG